MQEMQFLLRMSAWDVTPSFAPAHQSSVGCNLNETKAKHLQIDFNSIFQG